MENDSGHMPYDIQTIQKDPLTGAYSRASFSTVFESLIKNALADETSVSLIIIDIDYFKSVNDAYGHTRGDKILCQVAERLFSVIRMDDLFFRYGGDEFVLLLPESNKEMATGLANRIHKEMHTASFEGDPPLTVTLSMGLASFPEDTINSEELFKIADKRTYEAKRQGRDRVVTEITGRKPKIPFETVSTLIERTDQQEKAFSFLQALGTKGKGILQISGDPGTGRTSFLNMVSEKGSLEDFQIISLYANEDLKDEAYGPLSAGAGLPPLNFTGGKTALFQDFRKKVLKKDKKGLIFAIDNISSLDKETFSFIEYFFSWDGLEQIGIIYTAPSYYAEKALKDITPFFDEVKLNPLSIKGLMNWLTDLLKEKPSDPFTAWLHKETEGYPGLVQMGLNHLLKKGVIHQIENAGWGIKKNYADIKLRSQLKVNNPLTPNNLPTLLSEFIGRDKEIEEITQLLERYKLLTLVGPGGIGKTRLAIQISRRLMSHFPHGVYFIPLTAINETELVISKIAEVLGVAEQNGLPLVDSVTECIANKQILLILDNFEQVIHAAPTIARLFTAETKLKIIVTSREILNIRGEFSYVVHPLTLPQEAVPLTPEETRDYSAIQLFVKRAQTIKANFRVTEKNLHTIIEICRHLDGLPLAIELATARLRMLPPDQLLKRLNKSLQLLTTGSRDLPTRQQTMRAAIDWSYKLLNNEDKQLYRMLGAFTGSFTYEAALFVCENNCSFEEDLLDHLESLLNKSLIQKIEDPQGDTRFKMLETIREYAIEQLSTQGELNKIKEKHSIFYLDFVENAEAELSANRQDSWMEKLHNEQNNIRSALLWQVENNKMEEALRLTGSIWKFWHMHHYLTEGRRWFDIILKSTQNIRTRTRVKALWGGGWIYLVTGDMKQAHAYFQEGAELAEIIGDDKSAGQCLHGLGALARLKGDYQEAKDIFKQSLEIFKKISDIEHIAWTYEHLGIIAHEQNQPEEAIELMQNSIDLFQKKDMLWPFAEATSYLGDVYLEIKDFDRAKELYKRCSSLYDELGATYSISMARIKASLGRIAFEEGDYKKAVCLYKDSISRSKELHDTPGVLWKLGRIAEMALKNKQTEEGVRILGALEALCESLDIVIPPVETNYYKNSLEQAKEILSQPTFDEVWNKGRSMDLDEVVTYSFKCCCKP